MPMNKAMAEAYKAKGKACYERQAKAYREKKAKANAIISAMRVSSKKTHTATNSK